MLDSLFLISSMVVEFNLTWNIFFYLYSPINWNNFDRYSTTCSVCVCCQKPGSDTHGIRTCSVVWSIHRHFHRCYVDRHQSHGHWPVETVTVPHINCGAKVMALHRQHRQHHSQPYWIVATAVRPHTYRVVIAMAAFYLEKIALILNRPTSVTV